MLKDIARRLRAWIHAGDSHERSLEISGRLLANHVSRMESVGDLSETEFRVFSQWGDDGIIQWLVSRLPQIPRRFVEFGVEDYSESNTRFLMVNNHWSGLVMDGSAANIARLRRRPWFWRHDLTALCAFATRDNVNTLISEWAKLEPVGLLHIDVDGVDYWLWDAIDCISPMLVIMEYNANFGGERAITVPYRADFARQAAHYSGQYFGASIAALAHLAKRKGYALVGSNSAGNNAYFVRRDALPHGIRELSAQSAFVQAGFRDSRDREGRLDYRSFVERQALIRGMPVVDVSTGQVEPF